MVNSTQKSILTNAGKALLARLNADEQALVIDKMVFANIPNRQEFPQPEDGLPSEYIVYQEPIEQRGRLSEHAVIYSSTLRSSVGPFEFNWTGAYCSEHETLVTIDHHTLTPKTVDEAGVAGNTLVRSLVLEYKDAAAITNITVEPESWQYNASKRLVKMDLDVAQSLMDQNGTSWFIEEGFLVTNVDTGKFKVGSGVGYVNGFRVSLDYDRSLTTSLTAANVYIDCVRDGRATGEQFTEYSFVITEGLLQDYVDDQKRQHYVCKLAEIKSSTHTVDLRPKSKLEVGTGEFYAIDGVHVEKAQGVSFDLSVDNRDTIYSLKQRLYVPLGVKIRCNFLPDDDVRQIYGEGEVLTRDIWGNEHKFDLYRATHGPRFTPSNRLNMGMRLGTNITVGVIGDSITDGADASGWSANPIDGSGNLRSSNYDHNKNGGVGSWFRIFIDNLNTISAQNAVLGFNASSSGKKLMDGWSYRNFDYGFFQNHAYQNRAPDVLFVAMGVNDNGMIADNDDFDTYWEQFDKLIRKAWGYGSTVGFVSVTNTIKSWSYLEGAIKRSLDQQYRTVEVFDLAKYLEKFRTSGFETSFDLWYDVSNVYDITHPNDVGHRFLGGAMTKEVLGSQIASVQDGVNIIPQTNNDTLVRGYPSGNDYDPVLENVSGGYLDEFKGLSYVAPNENVSCWYFLWCEDDDLSLVCMEPKANTYNGSGRAHSLKVMLNDFQSDETTYTVASTGLNSISSYMTTKISKLGYGLNLVRVIYDGQPSKVYLPIMMIRKNESLAVIPTVRRRFSSTLKPISLFGSQRDFLNRRFQPTDARDELPDAVDGKTYPVAGYVKVQTPNKCGVAVFAKEQTNEGLKVIRKDSATISLKRLNDTLIEDIALNVSNDWAVQWTAQPNKQGQITVVGTDGTSITRTIDDLSGGACLFVNESTTQETCIVFGGALQID
ncbi:phage tail protein [Vibrio alginolyticus]|uniref:phage tail-collar fiber domain-containing protein n=1 Tax=Vibrio alginolyticus TaxID=663 RepID=UPI003D7E6B04